jgi:vitamin B12 transporter
MHRYLLAAPLLALASPVFAQTTAEDCAPKSCPKDNPDCIILAVCELRRDIVVTATSARQAPERSGRAISLLKSDDIARLQLPTVADLLATTLGVTVSANGGIGGFSAVRIRGAEGEQTLTLIDGVRVNDPSSPGGGFDFGNLLVGNIDRVEVLRGPNSVPWGSQAIGGVVNIVTAAPTDSFGGSARAEYGYKDRSNLSGNVGTRSGIVTASVGGGYFRDDGISAFKNGTERDGYRQYAANGRLGIAVSDAIDIDLRGNYANSRTKFDGFPPPTFSFADTPQFSKTEQIFGYAGINARGFDGKLRTRIAYTRADTDRENFDAPGAAAGFTASGVVDRFEAQADADLATGVRAVFGAEHERSRFDDGSSTVRTRATSGYAQLIVDPTANLTLTGGARIDDYRTYGTKTTVSGNLAWRPTQNTIVRAAYGEGFKAPTLFQLFSFFGNTTLDPERAMSYEIGIEQSALDGQLRFGVTAFQRNTRGQIDFISCFGQSSGICTNRPFGTFDNIRRTRAEGIEAFFRVAPTQTLTVEANYSYIDATNRDTGIVLLRRPRHSVNVSADWTAFDKLKLGASLRLASDSADSDFQTFSRTSLDGYELVAIRAAYPVTERLEVFGRVENLFDTQYETVSGFGTYGRNAHIGVRARF